MSVPFAACAPGKTRRTGQPVRRNSYHRGERERLIWRPLGKDRAEANRLKGAIRRAALRFDHSTKSPKTRMGGELMMSGLKVLDVLLELVDYRSGRLEPAIATIAEKAALGVRTVVRALRRLADAGFLDWLRRTEAVEQDGAGPQVQQITNAYWFALRGRAAGMVKLIMRGAAPADAKTREDVQAAVSSARNARLKEMRSPLGRVSASDVLSDEAKASLRRLKEIRSASATMAKNPGDRD
jgi:hypothetical protein